MEPPWGHPRGLGEQGNKVMPFILREQGKKSIKSIKLKGTREGTKAILGNREHRKSRFWFWGTSEQVTPGRASTLEWSVGKLMLEEGLNQFYSPETSPLSPDAIPSGTTIQIARKQKAMLAVIEEVYLNARITCRWYNGLPTAFELLWVDGRTTIYHSYVPYSRGSKPLRR